MKSERWLSLDVFRGMTIAAMILVNSPGNPTAYTPLDHAEWNGWTLTDLVFPFFVFILGISLFLSLSKRLEKGASLPQLYPIIFKRTLIIFGFGLLLNGFPYYHLSTIRILGVLQRLALCYGMTAILFLKIRKPLPLSMLLFALLLMYWGLLTLIPVPGFGAGDLSKEGNLAAYIDRLLLNGHLYRPVYDPEGFLSTLPAIASALSGVLAGEWWVSNRSDKEKLYGFWMVGLFSMAAGLLWNHWFPINKALWTSSYVLFTSGAALCILAFCYWSIDLKGYRAWGNPFVFFGVNAITLYMLHVIGLKLQNLWKMPLADGTQGNLRLVITEHLFSSWTSPPMASLLYALSYTCFWGLIAWLLYKKNIRIHI